MKTCTRCHATKPLDAFHRSKRTRDGRNFWCAQCMAEYAASKKGVKSEYDRAYLEKNRERVRQYQRAYHAANRNRRLAERRAYLTANPHLKWAASYRYRARKFGNVLVVEGFTRDDVVARYGDGCFYCPGGRFDELDHHLAISLGGEHMLDNVRPSCRPCNMGKAKGEIRKRRELKENVG